MFVEVSSCVIVMILSVSGLCKIVQKTGNQFYHIGHNLMPQANRIALAIIGALSNLTMLCKSRKISFTVKFLNCTTPLFFPFSCMGVKVGR